MGGYYNITIDHTKPQDRQPFDHQKEAFKALKNTFNLPIKGYKGSLLVLPTGAGKTYTAVNWICKNILTQNIKVLWLAQSTYLLDQAVSTFKQEIHNIYDRNQINLRVVSSSDEHQNSGSIQPTDDILICTTQTAIRACFNEASVDVYGNPQLTPFQKYIDSFKYSELFVVIDEAHHVPAYGCRSLLLEIRERIQNLYMLGLTATPMHNDERISGWLWKIFDQGNSKGSKGICYEADQIELQTAQILAVPKYFERPTGLEFEVDDKLYTRLVKQHKDLPDYIVEDLANNSPRNDFIVNDYIKNKSEYGKTMIFADRWYQCEYIVQKLKENDVWANAVYSKIDGKNALFQEGSGRRSNKDNDQVLQDFRDDVYEVVVNVKMLTEGVDVPDVRTVMITRQTTSPILFRQMVGRALRGKKIGGKKDYANIVIFNDTWKQLLPWVNKIGGTEIIVPEYQGYSPREKISILAVREACGDIDFSTYGNITTLFDLIPVGWYAADYTVAIIENEEESLITVREPVLAFNFNKVKYESLLDTLISEYKDDWADEKKTDEELNSIAEKYAIHFFDNKLDNIDGNLIANICCLIRHVAQNNSKPLFIDFEDRNLYDIDELYKQNINNNANKIEIIKAAYYDVTRHWEVLYKSPSNFIDAYNNAEKRYIMKQWPINEKLSDGESIIDNKPSVLTEEMKGQVLERDHYTCVCCDKQNGKGVRLQIDHILPVTMGGKNEIDNLQTLCMQCNLEKGTNEIDYRRTKTYLNEPRNLILYSVATSDLPENVMARIVNNIYHCKAFCRMKYSKTRNGKNYSKWEVELFKGNNPKWLEGNEFEIVKYFYKLGWKGIEMITVSVGK